MASSTADAVQALLRRQRKLQASQRDTAVPPPKRQRHERPQRNEEEHAAKKFEEWHDIDDMELHEEVDLTVDDNI
ncbi:hypothetical protein DL770_006268 [Monosporascus sp. CRB-9-2]|nr:hypothetical protein DL770_006268 [Monosporascus sp. CRB-9-2]